MDMGLPSLKLKVMLESNPLKARILVRRLAVFYMSYRVPLLRPRFNVVCAPTCHLQDVSASLRHTRNNEHETKQ